MSFFFGASGDTELFEKTSNIKGLRASEQKNILYIPHIRATVLKQPPFFCPLMLACAPAALCVRYSMGQQEVHKYEAPRGCH